MGSEIKLHRRDLRLDGQVHTILSLRPSDPYRFATNFFHETWHLLSDQSGGRLIGRMCWSMAFQRKPNTILLIDYPNLVTNPFDADPSNPIVIANSDLGTPSRQVLSDLQKKLPFRSRSEGTVQLSSFGLDTYTDNPRAYFDEHGAIWAPWRKNVVQVDRINGVIMLSATAANLKIIGIDLASIGNQYFFGQDSSYLDQEESSGEVQIFRDFTMLVSLALVARTELFPGRSSTELSPAEKQAVYDRIADRGPKPES
jgi:hypothetical protein